MMKQTRWSDEETDLLLELVQKRERLDFVASEFGRSIDELRRRLRELGIESVCRRVVVRLPAHPGA
jgi:hypothetical protein